MSKLLGLEGRLATVADKVFWLVVVVGVLLILFYAGKTAFTRMIHKYSQDKDNPQLATLLTVLRSAWKYLMLLVGVVTVLNILGMSITATSLLAAAGAGGLIVGMGAQDFIKDILNGFTIIMENQYSVGDYVHVNGMAGTVINLSLRRTRIIGDNKETITIPNSDIGTVINYTRREYNAMCYVCIKDEKQLADALAALRSMTGDFKSEFAEGKARVMGVTDIHPYGVEIGVECLCKIGYILELKYALNEAMALALVEAGVAVGGENISVTEGNS